MKEILHIYTRVSTTIQEEEGTSLETQLELGIERSEKLKMSYKVWNEGGRSSSKDDLSNRPVLTDLLQGIDDGIVKHLYVYNTDRLSRNLNTWGMIRFKLIGNEIVLHTPTGKQNLTDPQTNLMLGILTEISQYDNQLRTERFRLGKLKRIRGGGWHGGPSPYGYKNVDSRLVLEETEAKWVKFIYEQYADGCSLDEIRSLLLQNVVITRRNNTVWTTGSIDRVLINSHYGGFYNYTDKKSGETLRVSCPSIISSTLIKKAQDVRKSRSYGRGGSKRVKTSNQKHTYLLKDLLTCGNCGSRYGGNYKTTQTSYYSCNQKTNKFRTTHTDQHFICSAKRNIRIDKTDEVVWNAVVDVVEQSHLFKNVLKAELLGETSFRQSNIDTKKQSKRISKLEKDIKDVTDQIVNIETDKLIGKRTKEESDQIIRNVEQYRLGLESQKEQLSTEIREDNQQRKWFDWVKEFGNRIEHLRESEIGIDEKKKFLEGIIDDVVIKNTDSLEHELNIKFRLPYVGDKLIWKDDEQKSKGYMIKNGKKTKKLRVNLLKKSTC